MFSRLKAILFKPRGEAMTAAAEVQSTPNLASWEQIEEFERWVETQPNDVVVDLLCRLTMRLLPTVLVGDPFLRDGSGFQRTLEASIVIVSYRINVSTGLPSRYRPMSGTQFFDLCEGGGGPLAPTTWHAVESIADSYGRYLKGYLSEVNTNIRRKAPESHGHFFLALLADRTAWEAWATSGADPITRTKLITSPLWQGMVPADAYLEGLPKLIEYLQNEDGPAHRLLLTIYTKT